MDIRRWSICQVLGGGCMSGRLGDAFRQRSVYIGSHVGRHQQQREGGQEKNNVELPLSSAVRMDTCASRRRCRLVDTVEIKDCLFSEEVNIRTTYSVLACQIRCVARKSLLSSFYLLLFFCRFSVTVSLFLPFLFLPFFSVV